MSNWAKPGVKCVCVARPKNGDLRGVLRVPDIGEVLTVREVFVGLTEGGQEVVALKFHEIVNPLTDTVIGRAERGYPAFQYRPLITQSDDVALFAHHLVGQPAGVDA